ncbi:hypothetical protein D3C78_1742440 [compost metagenome]
MRISAPLPLTRVPMPLVSLETMPSFQLMSLGKSTMRSPTMMPIWSALRILSTVLAAVMRAFEGIQPTLRQTPPREFFSTKRVFLPSWASRMAAT